MSKNEKQDVSPEVANDFVERLRTTSTKREPLKRRLSAPKLADLGTQIVGSQHTYLVPLPQTVDPIAGDAIASALIAPTAVMKPVHDFGPAFPLKFGEPARQFELEYMPISRGSFTTDVHFVARWEDGHVEDTAVPVHAAARELTDARNAPEAPPVHDIGTNLVAPLTKEQPSAAQTLGFTQAISDLGGKVELLFKAQAEGVNAVESEQSHFRAPPADKPLWEDLVEIAIEMGVGVISERLGAIVGKGVVRLLGQEFEHHHAAVVKSFEKATEAGFEAAVHAGHVAELEPPENKEGKEEASVGEAGSDVEDQNQELSKQPVSTDTAITFFSAQRALIAESKDAARSSLEHQMIKLAGELGPDASAVGNAIAKAQASVTATDPYVMNGQAAATTAQWMKYLARRDLGEVTASTANGPIKTTMMAEARSSGTLLAPRSANGLLALDVAWHDSRLIVETAAVTGIAQDAANRLLHMNLKTARLPLVLRIEGATITIDEAGRVRSDGGPVKPHNDGVPWNEVQDARDVQEVVDALFSSTLATHGLKEIKTNDTHADKK